MRLMRESDGQWIEIDGYQRKALLGPRDLHHEGAVVQFVTMPAGANMALHAHEGATEVWHVLAGTGGMRIGDDETILSSGDTITCGPNELHSVFNDGNEPFECIVFKLNWNPADRTEADAAKQDAFRVKRQSGHN